MAANPFFEPSPLPYHYPDFATITEEHFLPAFTEGMAQQRAEVDAITANAEPATFANTIVALERSGEVLRRVGNTRRGESQFDQLRPGGAEPSAGETRIGVHRIV